MPRTSLTYVFNKRPPPNQVQPIDFDQYFTSQHRVLMTTAMKGPSPKAVYHAISILFESLNAKNEADFATSVTIDNIFLLKR